MIAVALAHAPPEQLRRLAACPVWYMPPALYAAIRKGEVNIDRVEAALWGPPHAVEVIVDRFIPDGFIVGRESGDRLWLTLSDVRLTLDVMPGEPVRSAT